MKKTLASVFAIAIMVSAFAGTVSDDKNKKADRAKTEAAKKEIMKQPRKQMTPEAKKAASVKKVKSNNN